MTEEVEGSTLSVRREPSPKVLVSIVAVLVAVCSLTATAAFNAGFHTGLARARIDTGRMTLLAEEKEMHGIAALLHGVKPSTVSTMAGQDLPKGWPCEKGESLFMNLCYVDCGEATGGKFPSRYDACTCCSTLPCDKTPLSFAQDCVKFDKGAKGFDAIQPRLTNCRDEQEELFEGLCYLKCEILTAKMYSVRTGMNTCSDESFNGNWTMGIGPCSGFGVGGTECMPHIPLPSGMGVPPKGPISIENEGVPPLGLKTMPEIPPMP